MKGDILPVLRVFLSRAYKRAKHVAVPSGGELRCCISCTGANKASCLVVRDPFVEIRGRRVAAVVAGGGIPSCTRLTFLIRIERSNALQHATAVALLNALLVALALAHLFINNAAAFSTHHHRKENTRGTVTARILHRT